MLESSKKFTYLWAALKTFFLTWLALFILMLFVYGLGWLAHGDACYVHKLVAESALYEWLQGGIGGIVMLFIIFAFFFSIAVGEMRISIILLAAGVFWPLSNFLLAQISFCRPLF